MNPHVTHLDLRGMKCPAPIVATSKAVSQIGGRTAVLRILADDEAFPVDLESWCRATKSELSSLDRGPGGVFSAVVRVNPGAEPATAPPAPPAAPARVAPAAPVAIAAPPPAPVARAAPVAVAARPAAAHHIDCRGKRCPEPIIVLAKEARKLTTATDIEILADDDAFPMDVKSWCRTSGSTLLHLDEISGGAYRALIRARARSGVSGAQPVVATPPSSAIDATTELHPDHVETDATLPAGVGFLAGSRSLVAPPASALPASAPMAAPAPAPAPMAAPAPAPAPPATPMPSTNEPVDEPRARQRLRVDLSSLPPDKCREYLASLDQLSLPDAVVRLSASHATFAQDLAVWCAQAGHILVGINTEGQPMHAEVRLNPAGGESTALVPHGHAATQALVESHKQATLLVLHNDLEALLAALMTANTAASSGMNVNVFFAFWGINVLRGDRVRRDEPRQKVSFMQRMFKAMMPRGPRRQRLGKLSFGGMGGWIMRGIMRKNNILNLEDLIDESIALGVRFTVCTMSMSVMGITRRELVDLPNMEYAGVTSFVGDASGAGMSLVF